MLFTVFQWQTSLRQNEYGISFHTKQEKGIQMATALSNVRLKKLLDMKICEYVTYAQFKERSACMYDAETPFTRGF